MQDDTLFDSQNAAYAQAMFEEYARNPDALPDEWRKLFDDRGNLAVAEGLLVPDQLTDSRSGPVQPGAAAVVPPAPEPAPASPRAPLPSEADDESRALLELLPGDALLFRTGHILTWLEDGDRETYLWQGPGLGIDCMEWLRERDVEIGRAHV